ncbi:MAG: glycoside hydrolase family 16 protein [Bacteroidales bacterium]|nr:glycoside hydrolase family 16 protein [Bacteroidales bacterium]
MKKSIIISVLALCGLAFAAAAQDTDSRFMRPFTENFSASKPENFGTAGSALRYYCGVPSLSELGSDVMLLRINPSDPAGAGRGPEISTPKMTHFGTYSARIRVPDVKAVQPNIGVVVGYFTYRFTRGYGLSEIDFEWLVADPTLIYIGTWTSDPNNVENLQRVGRTINLATGQILYTNYRSYHDGNRNHDFASNDDAALTPRTIPAITGYDASKQFYVYGFDWYPNRLTWWIEHPDTGEKIILWDYQGTTPNFSGIPQPPTTYLLNFWHTNDWSVDTNPRSKEAPKYPYFLEIDWMKYEPYDDVNIAWRKENNF